MVYPPIVFGKSTKIVLTLSIYPTSVSGAYNLIRHLFN